MSNFDTLIDNTSKALYDNPAYGKEYMSDYLAKLFIELKGYTLKDYEHDFDLLEKIKDILYVVEDLETIKQTKREVFFICISNVKNLVRFNNLIGKVKDYSYAKMHNKVKECLPFIKGATDLDIDIPINPNEQYLTTLKYLNDILDQSEKLNIGLLNIVYGKKSKAQKPTLQIDDLIASRNFWKEFSITHPSTKKESLKKVEQFNKLIAEK